MTDERIEQIRARVQAATAGEWELERNERTERWEVRLGESKANSGSYRVSHAPIEFPDLFEEDGAQYAEMVANADLIANSPSDLTYLLDRLEGEMQANEALAEAKERATRWVNIAVRERDEARTSRDALLTAAKAAREALDLKEDHPDRDKAVALLDAALVPSELAPSQIEEVGGG